MNKKLGVIFCTDGIFPYQIGGMQRHSRLLIEELSKFDVQIVVVHPHEGEKIFSNSNIIEYSIRGIDKQKNYLKECYRYSKDVFKIIQKYPNYVIYSQGLSVWYNVRKLSERLVVNPHGLEPFQSFGIKNKLVAIPFKIIFQHIFRKSKYIISLGGKLSEILSKYLSKSKIAEIPNAINFFENSSAKQFENKSTTKFLFVARFSHNKGIHVLTEAIKQLNLEGFQEKIHFTLAGEGPLYNEVKKKFAYPNITYTGFINDNELSELYKTSDVFLFPTLFEGMPTVVLEAMSYGMPIIVSDTGATSVLVDSTNGFLISPGSVSQVKKAVVNFIKLNAKEKQVMSGNSLKRVKDNFVWDKVALKYLELFNSINK